MPVLPILNKKLHLLKDFWLFSAQHWILNVSQATTVDFYNSVNLLDSWTASPTRYRQRSVIKGLLSSSLRSAHAIFLSNAQPHAGHVTRRPAAGVLAVNLLARYRRKSVLRELRCVPGRRWVEIFTKFRISITLAHTTNIAEPAS